MLNYCFDSEHKKMYREALKLQLFYFTDKCVVELWHEFDFQTSKVLNKSIVKCAPEYKEYFMTMSLFN